MVSSASLAARASRSGANPTAEASPTRAMSTPRPQAVIFGQAARRSPARKARAQRSTTVSSAAAR